MSAIAKIGLGGLVLLLGSALALELFADAPATNSEPEVSKGTSCAALGRARQALEAGDDRDVVTSLQEAARRGEQALERSDARFGVPERIALKAAARVENRTEIGGRSETRLEEQLVKAQRHCSLMAK